ncbi:hypothetical protein QBC35DRAFT_545029 [Podospora australis]|uniref:DUF7580 domain-containing protein n=1 Tax=Podospora australis TaxID=1536484 RepID=A0AAN7AEM3_9PEZI|nr:hypothetical protein QBC35DRAFT_545029 [Podospora australis]
MKRKLKRIVFILRKENYQALIAEIRDGVSNLESVMTFNTDLEPERKKRSRDRILRLMRGISDSLYRALRSAVTCACPAAHDFGLKLLSQPPPVIPEDDDDDIAAKVEFLVAMSYTTCDHSQDDNGCSQACITAKDWRGLSIKSTRTSTQSVAVSLVSRPKRAVRFSSSSHTVIDTNTSSVTADNRSATAIATFNRTPLCTLEPLNIDHLPTKHRTFEIFPTNIFGDTGDWTLVPLRDILNGHDANSMSRCTSSSYRDRLGLAQTIAWSLLQLESTTWFSGHLTSDRIFLAERNGVVLFAQAFVLKELPESSAPDVVSATTTSGKHSTLFALGVIRIELVLGRTISEHRLPEADTLGFTRHADRENMEERALKSLDQVNTAGGHNYASAVRRCLQCEYYHAGMQIDSQGFQREVSIVVDKLEAGMREIVS